MVLNERLKKSLGQHLLKDKNLLKKIVRLSRVTAADAVIEIGPGHGDLTKVIAAEARSVTAVELDRRFAPLLSEVSDEFPNVHVIFSDILDVQLSHITGGEKVVVLGNIPYNVTGEILFKLLRERKVVTGAYLVMQREVAERIVSRSHSRTYGALSVIFQLHAAVRLLMLIKPGVFIPPPKVDSALISILFHEDERGLDGGIVDFIKACFRYKRKYLRHALKERYDEGEIEALYRHMVFPPTARAEEIEPDGYVAMYRFLQERSTHNE